MLMAGASVAYGSMAPEDLRCEHLVDPVGINTLVPRFSWKNSCSQTAYEILAGTDSVSVANGKQADLWKSGRVKSRRSFLVEYAGKPLVSRAQVWWKVRVWDSKGKPSDWSRTARFGVGIINDSGDAMRGEYIGMPEENGDARSPILHKNLRVDNRPGRVMAHVNSLGYHELYINGRKAGNRVLAPGVSQLDSRSLIVAYDITDMVKAGDNDIVLHLGQGWYKPTTFKAEYGGPLVKVEIDRVSGLMHEPLLASDADWRAASGGRYDTGSWNALNFGGEHVDGRLEPADMSTSSLSKLKWARACTVPVVSIASPDMSEGNRIVSSSGAVAVIPQPDGSYMADMGRVLTGWFSFTPAGVPAGTEITMEYSDNLKPDGQFDPQGESDVYIVSGRKDERFCNKFNHHAYRYVMIKGLKSAPSANNLVAHQIQGAYDDASSFECSDSDLNAVHDMIKYTMRCLTFSGYMVDCPHLERTGYGGDGNSSTMTLQTMYDVVPTYANWLQAWADVMDADGSLPHVAPAGGGGGGPYWCGFIVLAPWRTWLNYGDRRMLETYYPLMKKWMGYVESYFRDGLLRRWPDTHNRVWYLGDWLAPWGVDTGNEVSVDLVNNCLVSDCLDKMSRAARTLGRQEEAEMWDERREALNAAIHKTFYDPATSQYATGSQLDMAYPVIVGATPELLRPAVRKSMLRLSHDKWKDHIAAGLVGVPVVTQWAIDECQPDFMATMLRQHDYPGYMYMIDNGATATWEYWSGERSRVHNCYNGVGLWFYQGLGGIVPDPDAPGYEHFTINPQPASGVDWASVTKETPSGTIALKWERVTGGFDYTLCVPAGSTATVKVPAGMHPEGNQPVSAAGGDIVLTAGSYHLGFRK